LKAFAVKRATKSYVYAHYANATLYDRIHVKYRDPEAKVGENSLWKNSRIQWLWSDLIGCWTARLSPFVPALFFSMSRLEFRSSSNAWPQKSICPLRRPQKLLQQGICNTCKSKVYLNKLGLEDPYAMNLYLV